MAFCLCSSPTFCLFIPGPVCLWKATLFLLAWVWGWSLLAVARPPSDGPEGGAWLELAGCGWVWGTSLDGWTPSCQDIWGWDGWSSLAVARPPSDGPITREVERGGGVYPPCMHASMAFWLFMTSIKRAALSLWVASVASWSSSSFATIIITSQVCPGFGSGRGGGGISLELVEGGGGNTLELTGLPSCKAGWTSLAVGGSGGEGTPLDG
jgi:hypothetical protein